MEEIKKSPNSQIKIAVIGLGYWGPNLVRNFYQLENCKIEMVCDFKEDRLDFIKKNYPAIKATKNFKNILENPEIKAVVIALPTKLHHKFVELSLKAGKHVLVEKPFAFNSKEAKELIRIAKRKKRVLMVDHTFIYSSAVQKIKELIDKKELGKIYYFDSERVNLGLVRSDVNVVGDLATHDISIINYLFTPKALSVWAIGSSHILNRKEEMAHIILKDRKGIISHINVSWLSPLKIRKIILAGDKKMVLYDDVEPTEKIKIYDKGIDINKNKVTPFTPFYRSGDIIMPKLDQTEPLKKMAEHFIDCIRNNKKPITDGEFGLKIIEMFEAIQKSIREGGKLIKIN